MDRIISFTPTGVLTTRQNSLAPLTAPEIVEEVHAAYQAGITFTHIHARDPETFENTYKKNVYRDILEGVKKHCPDLAVCVSLTGRLHSELEKRTEVLELQPDMGSLTMSSLNFPQAASVNQPETITAIIARMEEYGVVPEIECFDTGMLNYTNYLIGKGILKTPYYINVIFGNLFNAQTDLASIASVMNCLPENAKVCFGGIGKEQLKMNLMGLMYADGVRVGLEDNLYYRDKEKATNLALLQRVHRVMNEMGLTVLAPAAFKAMGYANNKVGHSR